MPQHAIIPHPHRRRRAFFVGIIAACTGALVLGSIFIVFGTGAFSAQPSITYAASDQGASTSVHNSMAQGIVSGTDRANALVLASINAAREEIEKRRLAASPEARLDQYAPYTPTLSDISALSGQEDPFAFCLNATSPDPAPVLTPSTIAALAEASDCFLEYGWDASYLLVDLNTGRGLAANVDARVYGASAFKAPYALYVCETQLDTGASSLESACSEGVASSYLKGEKAHDNTFSYALGPLIENSIIYSDNDSFRILRANFDGSSFTGWLSTLGLSPSLANDTWFPRYTTRESSTLWLHLASYVESSSPSAAWLFSLLSKTETSFIREAICKTSGASVVENTDESTADDNDLQTENISVISKAGWISGTDYYDGTCDTGVVTFDGHRYLLCVMSSAPSSEEAITAIESLIATVFAARGDLAEIIND